MKEVTAASFESDVMGSEVPVVVDVYSETCRPCKMIKPMLDKLAAEYEGRASIVAMKFEDNRELAKQLSVSAVPTLFVIKGGTVLRTLVGLVAEAKLREVIDGLLGDTKPVAE